LSENIIEAQPVEDATTGLKDDHPAAVDEATTDEAPDANDDRGGNREAAKYRRQLREAEAARDALGERLAALQRGQAETFAREHLADGADLWRDGLDLTALLDDDGNLDAAKVAEAARAARKAHPHWAAPTVPKRNPASVGAGLRSGATGTDHRPGVSWAGLLNNRAGTD